MRTYICKTGVIAFIGFNAMPKCMSTSEFCVLVELALLVVQYTNLEILFRMNFFF